MRERPLPDVALLSRATLAHRANPGHHDGGSPGSAYTRLLADFSRSGMMA
jgi:hypothetical protein